MKTIRNFVFLALILAVNTSCERFYSIYDDLDENGQEQVQQAVTLVAPQDSIRVDLTLGEADSLDLVVYVAKVLNNKYFTKRWSAHENDLKYFAVTAGDIDGNGFKRVMQFHEQDNGGFLQWKSDNAERLWEYRINPHLDITIYVDENPMYGYVLEGRPLKGNHSFRGYWYIPSLEMSDDTLGIYYLDLNLEVADTTATGDTTALHCFSIPDLDGLRLYKYVETPNPKFVE